MDALAALRLQIEFGADEALEAEPVDRLCPSGGPAGASAGVPEGGPVGAPVAAARPAATAEPIRPVGAATPLPAPRETGGNSAQAPGAAAGAATLAELFAAITGFTGCALRNTATRTVLPAGDPAAGLLLIGDAPEDADDRAGQPFAGAAGATLDRMLGSIGLDRGGLLLAPLLPWRPPGARPPNAAELTACLPFLHRLIALTAPRRIVLLGPLPARALLGRHPRALAWTPVAVPEPKLQGPALVLPSPAAVIVDSAARRTAWAGLRLLRRALDEDVNPA